MPRRGPVSGGTTEPSMMPRHARTDRSAVREQAVDQQAELVGRPLAQRLQPPASNERRPVEDAEHDVGVADVNR